MTVTIERREGRVTQSEYRAVVEIAGRRAEGPWQFTKGVARKDVPALERSLFDADEAGRRLDAESHRRTARIRAQMDVDRRVIVLL